MKKEWLDYFNEPYIVLSVKEVLFDESSKPIQFKVKNINTFSFKNSPESSILYENKGKYNSNYSFRTNSNRKSNTRIDRIDKEEKANLELLLFSQDYVNTIFNKIEKKFGLKVGFFSTRSDGSYNDNENNDIEIYNNYGFNMINRSNSARGDVCADFVDKILNNVELNKNICDNHNIENTTFPKIKEEFKKTKNSTVSNINIHSNNDKSIKVIENDAVYDTNINQKQDKIRNKEEDLLIDLPKQITNRNNKNNTQKSSLSSFKHELRKQQITIPITTHISNTNRNNVVNSNKNADKERLNNEEYSNLINEARINSYLNNVFEINNINSGNSSHRSKRKRNTINFNQEEYKEVNDLINKANIESNGKKGKNPDTDNDIENYEDDDYNIYEDIKFHTSEDVGRNNINSNNNTNKTNISKSSNIKTLFKIKDFDEKIKKINNFNNQEDREDQKKIYKKNSIPNKSYTMNNVVFKNTTSSNIIDNCNNAVNKSSVTTIKSPIAQINFNKININNENNNNSSNSEVANNNLINNNSSDSNKQPYEKQFSNTLRESNIKIRINLEKTNLEQERSLKLRLESKLENTDTEFDQNMNNTNTNQFNISIKENNNDFNANNNMQNKNNKNLVIIKKRIPRNSPNTPPAKSGKHEWNYNHENNNPNKNSISCNENIKSIDIPLQKPKSKVSKNNDNVIKSKEIEVIINSNNNNIEKTDEKENIINTDLTNEKLEKKLHSFQNQNSVIKEENKRLLEVLEFIKQMHNIESNTLDEFLNNMSENKVNDLDIKTITKSDNQTDLAVYSRKQNANRINSVSISNNLTSKIKIENKVYNSELNDALVECNKKYINETDDDLSKISSQSNKVLEYSHNQSNNVDINDIENKISKNYNTKGFNQLSPIKGNIRNTNKNISFNEKEFNSKNKDIVKSNLNMEDNNIYNASDVNTYRTNLFDESLSPRKIFKELDRCYNEEKSGDSNNHDKKYNENKEKIDDLVINLKNDNKNKIKNTHDSQNDTDKKENVLSEAAIKSANANNLKNAFIKAKSTVNKIDNIDNESAKVKDAILKKQHPSVKFINNDIDTNNKMSNVFSNLDNYSYGLNIPHYNKYINTNTEKYKEEYLSKYTKLHKYKRELEEKTKKKTINVQLYTRKEKDNMQKKVIIGKLNANIDLNKAKKFKNLIDTNNNRNIINKNCGYITFNNININNGINNSHINHAKMEKYEENKTNKEQFDKDSVNKSIDYEFNNNLVNKNANNLDNLSSYNDKDNDHDLENNSDDFFNDEIAI